MASSKIVFFIVVLFIYIASVIANVSLLLLTYIDTSLHKPMYIFLFNLIANGMIGSTAVWPKAMVILLTDVATASYESCLTQVFFIGTYGSCNYSVLTVMAYDRFVSIFQPLQYHTIMTPQKVKQLLLAANIMPIALIVGQILMTSRIPLCKSNLHKLFCDNLSVSNLSCDGCFQSQLSNLYGVCLIIVIVVLPIFLILVSYVKIIELSLKSSKNARKKVFETCMPHLIVFVNFSFVSLFSVIYNRVNAYLPGGVNIFVSSSYILLPPLLHPIIYGIKTKEIRQSLSKIKTKAVLALS